MINIPEKKSKILAYLKEQGPTLPIRMGNVVGMEPFLASAVMSELLNERKVQMSHLKVGSSSLYLLEGQEPLLEKFIDVLKGVEKDTCLRLKQQKVLKDNEEQPQTRVALRSIKDFAIPFEYQGETYWRWAFATSQEIEEIMNPKPKVTPVLITEQKPEPKQEQTIEQPKIEHQKKERKETKTEPKKEEQITLLTTNEQKGAFYEEVMNYLKKKKIEYINDIEVEKKEFVGKIRITTELGILDFLFFAKNKKSITKEELSICTQRAAYHKMPCLILLRKELAKNTQKTLEDNHLIKFLTMP